MRIRVGAFGNLTGPVPDLQLVLSSIGAVQVELLDRIQSFGCVRIQFTGESGEKRPHGFGWCRIHRI